LSVPSLVADGCAIRVTFTGAPIALRKLSNFPNEQLLLILSRLQQLVGTEVKVLRARLIHWTKPLTSSLPLGILADVGSSKSEIVAENALLRQQLNILKRQVKRPACTKKDRILLVLEASVVRAWKQTLYFVQPETLLRWQREAFRLFWRSSQRLIPTNRR
jgi:putative transposase